MSAIVRDIRAAERATFDMIMIGGGVYGAFLTMEAARRGLRGLLLERDDFGGGVSANSLRIIHGGLRYLQSLDITRHHESVRERSWFLRTFPELVRPLACVMPLYNSGLRRPGIMRAVLRFNDLLSPTRNDGLPADRAIPDGFLADARETVRLFPGVDRNGLGGSAVWHDAVMLAPQRVIMESLRRAASFGASCLNYVSADGLVVHDGRIRAVLATDRETGRRCEFTAPVVVNCAGPWAGLVATRLGGMPTTLSHPSLAFNLVFDRSPLSDAALAVSPRTRPGPTYFVLPRGKRLAAGTVHGSWTGPIDRPNPDGPVLDDFLDSLNDCVPDLKLTPADIVHVDAGLLPARSAGTPRLATRPVIRNHGADGGPHGLVSVSGVKFTTARLVAERTLRAVFGPALREAHDPARERVPVVRPIVDFKRLRTCEDTHAVGMGDHLKSLIDEESVVHLDDLFLRRMTWADDSCDPRPIADLVAARLGWSDGRRDSELTRLAVQCRRSGMVDPDLTHHCTAPPPVEAGEWQAYVGS